MNKENNIEEELLEKYKDEKENMKEWHVVRIRNGINTVLETNNKKKAFDKVQRQSPYDMLAVFNKKEIVRVFDADGTSTLWYGV